MTTDSGVSADILRAVQRLHSENKTVPEMCKILAKSQTLIYHALAILQLSPHKNLRHRTYNAEEIEVMWNAGHSVPAIASQLDLCNETVYKALRRLGIPLDDRGQYRFEFKT